jgi:hypothetical protein
MNISNKMTSWRLGRYSVLERLNKWTPPKGVSKNAGYVRGFILLKSGVDMEKAAKMSGMATASLYSAFFTKLPKSRKNMDSHNRIRRVWYGMMRRCYTPEDGAYKWYGGRGIIVCKGWHSYETFKKWAISNGYSDNLTLERIKNDVGYKPSNCTWVTNKKQCRNRRTSKLITISGVVKSLAEWAEIYGVRYKMAWERIEYLGWEPIDAFTKPRRKL